METAHATRGKRCFYSYLWCLPCWWLSLLGLQGVVFFSPLPQSPFSVAPSRRIKCNLGTVPGSLFKTWLFNVSYTQQAVLAWRDIRNSEGFTPQVSWCLSPSPLSRFHRACLGSRTKPHYRLPPQPHQLPSKITCSLSPLGAPADEAKSRPLPLLASGNSLSSAGGRRGPRLWLGWWWNCALERSPQEIAQPLTNWAPCSLTELIP